MGVQWDQVQISNGIAVALEDDDAGWVTDGDSVFGESNFHAELAKHTDGKEWERDFLEFVASASLDR